MFGDLGKMMKLAMEAKTMLPQLQAKLTAAQYTAEAGGGAVRATVNGKLALTDIKIDRSLLAPGGADADMLEDLVKAAVSAAQEQAVEGAKAMVKELTGGIDIPGLGGMMP